MRIIFDSNIFISNFNLDGAEIVLLEQYISTTNSKLIVPTIVFQEVINKYIEEADDIINKVEQAKRKLDLNIELRSDISQESAKKYEIKLKAFLAACNVEYIDYEAIKHKAIVDRALRRKKPFTRSGNGYRDTLVWESILQDIKQHKDDYAFISGNHKDFADETHTELHPDLKGDLTVQSFSGTFHYFNSLEKFTDLIVKPIFAKSDILQIQIEKGVYKQFNIDAFIRDFQEKISQKISLPDRKYIDEITLSYVIDEYEVESVEVRTFEKSSENVLSINFVLLLEDVPLHGFMDRVDTYSLEDDSHISVCDWDWNEHRVEVEFYENISLTFEVIINERNGQVIDFSVPLAEYIES